MAHVNASIHVVLSGVPRVVTYGTANTTALLGGPGASCYRRALNTAKEHGTAIRGSLQSLCMRRFQEYRRTLLHVTGRCMGGG